MKYKWEKMERCLPEMWQLGSGAAVPLREGGEAALRQQGKGGC